MLTTFPEKHSQPRTGATAALDRRGCSRIGGLPDLPSGVLWPCVSAQPSTGRTHLAGQPLSFLMQLNLAEVSTLDNKQMLRPAGNWALRSCERDPDTRGADG